MNLICAPLSHGCRIFVAFPTPIPGHFPQNRGMDDFSFIATDRKILPTAKKSSTCAAPRIPRPTRLRNLWIINADGSDHRPSPRIARFSRAGRLQHPHRLLSDADVRAESYRWMIPARPRITNLEEAPERHRPGPPTAKCSLLFLVRAKPAHRRSSRRSSGAKMGGARHGYDRLVMRSTAPAISSPVHASLRCSPKVAPRPGDQRKFPHVA